MLLLSLSKHPNADPKEHGTYRSPKSPQKLRNLNSLVFRGGSGFFEAEALPTKYFYIGKKRMSVNGSEEIPQEAFAGGGEMGALIRSHDWSLSALGAVEKWSQSLKTAIGIVLGSPSPMFIWWGNEMINLYNDAYIPMLGQHHPEALGESAFNIWADVWDVVGPQAEAVLNQGKSSWNKQVLLILERNGYPEETYFTFSYSPVPADDGTPGGVFGAVTAETERVLNDRSPLEDAA